MALHERPGDLAIAAINEYIEASWRCIEVVKPDGGCLGMPAALLLFCVVEALGRALVGEQVLIDGKPQNIARGEPFRVLNHEIFGLNLTLQQIKLVEKSFRNLLAHNAIIGPGFGIAIGLAIDGVSPFKFSGDGTVLMSLKTLHGVVFTAWGRINRVLIHKASEAEVSRG